MSLNKFSAVDTGYDLKLDIGCDELKCNTLEIGGQQLVSGSYNPTITSLATLIPDPTLNNAFYTKVGNILTIQGKIAVDEWNSSGVFDISLPVGLSAASSGPNFISGLASGSTSVGSVSGFDNGLSSTTTFELRCEQNGGSFPAGTSAGVVKYVVTVECD